MNQVIEILPHIGQGPIHSKIVNIMAAGVLATQGARTPATMTII